MASWHQQQNSIALMQLWKGHPTMWSCVSDTHGCLASRMTFPTETAARAYAARTRDVVIPPASTAVNALGAQLKIK
jgi:hypothetical protein